MSANDDIKIICPECGYPITVDEWERFDHSCPNCYTEIEEEQEAAILEEG